VLAFFAEEVEDQGIDAYWLWQLMMLEKPNPVNAGSRWRCNMNP